MRAGARELAECSLWRTDPYEEVAAEVSAAQNISRGRASGQIHSARELRDRLPAVAAVFASGSIDYRMVSIIITRTENVEQDVMADLDAALAGHCVKWMRLSAPKLRDRVDLWVAKFDRAAVRVPPTIDDSRYVDIGETSPGMAGIWPMFTPRMLRCWTADSTRWPPRCVIWIRAPRRSGAPMPAVRWPGWKTPWPVSADRRTAPRWPSAKRWALS